MARADVTIQTCVSDNYRAGIQQPPIIKSTDGVLWVFYISVTDGDLYYQRSANNGLTWESPVSINTGTVSLLAVWPEWETPGDTGTKIHIWIMETDADDVSYYNLDTATSTLSTVVVVAALASGLGNNASTCISGTKSRGGNLYVAFDIDGGTETGFYRSTDGGANWGSRTDVNEATSDYYLLAPGFAADNQDILCIFWDRSASELSRKIYDDSANTWAETSIATSMTSVGTTTCTPEFAITVDAVNSKIVLIAWSNRDTLHARLRAWKIDESSITALTDVVSDSTDDQMMCALGMATDTNILYAFYGGKTDGSEIAGTSINIYYKTSSDAGSTWGSETVISDLAHNYDCLFTAPVFTGLFATIYRHSTTSVLDAILIYYAVPSGSAAGGSPVVGSFIIT
jgi:hypothetical protein